MANNKIQTTDLDFDGIKASLKNFLRGQQKFSDYDFEGSGLSILLDVLAYNTHFNALYMNLAVNEAFLDSASKRESVVSKAKELGYVPASAKSAHATVNVILTGSLSPVLTIPKYTKFTSTIDNKSLTFYTTTSYNADRESGQYVFQNLDLTEGTLLDFSYEADGINNVVALPNGDIDLSTLVVIVQDTAEASSFSTYNRSDTVLEANGDDLIYFVKEVAGRDSKVYHQLEFGNGVVGKALDAGNIVTVTYLVSNGDAGNGARTFRYADAPPSSTTAYVTTVAPSFGGADAEGVDDIKWNAPRAFVAQNRCVTVEDFKTVVNAEYPNASSINVWGGEDNDPPTYGNIYIAIKPADSERLSEKEKDYLLNTIIKPRCTVTVHPQIVDPEYLYVDLNTSFYYTPRETNKSAPELVELVRAAVEDYNETTLAKFGGILKGSVLSRIIDGAEASIKSSVSTISLRYNLKPVYNQTTAYTIRLGNPIYDSGPQEYSVSSTGLSILETPNVVYFEDEHVDGSSIGNLRLYYKVQNGKAYLPNKYGTINYKTGEVQIKGIVIRGIVGPRLEFRFKPESDDVAAANNRIVTLVMASNAITPKEDKVADKYDFTSGRN